MNASNLMMRFKNGHRISKLTSWVYIGIEFEYDPSRKLYLIIFCDTYIVNDWCKSLKKLITGNPHVEYIYKIKMVYDV